MSRKSRESVQRKLPPPVVPLPVVIVPVVIIVPPLVVDLANDEPTLPRVEDPIAVVPPAVDGDGG